MLSSPKYILYPVIIVCIIIGTSHFYQVIRTGDRPKEMAFIDFISAIIINKDDSRGQFVYVKAEDFDNSAWIELVKMKHVDSDGYIIDHWSNRIIKTSNEIISYGQDGIYNTNDDIVREYR